MTHLFSMTGQGQSEASNHRIGVAAEIRSVNHRGLKVSVRTPDSAGRLENKIETLVRQRIQRGSVLVQVRLLRMQPTAALAIDVPAVTEAAKTLGQIADQAGVPAHVDLVGLLALPGMLGGDGEKIKDQELWPVLQNAVTVALDRFMAMRAREAASMAVALRADAALIASGLSEIEVLAPQVVQRYQRRLLSKINAILDEHQLTATQGDVLREVQVFADRSDISEEITRLISHLDLFARTLDGDSGGQADPAKSEAVGRKLDFIIQEMFRETNTIGSKSGDTEISHHVVEIKCAIERMRELVQNLE